MINGRGTNKRQVLNYREAGDSYGCAECEHNKNLQCKVVDGGVYHDMRCDAWNDKSSESNWYFFLHSFKTTVSVLVKEGKTAIASMEFPLADDMDKKVMGILDTHTKALGCPDFVTNISPRTYRSMEFRSWLEYRGIQYRELDAEIDNMEFKVDGNMTALDVLSLLIDIAVVYPKEEGNNGKQ